MKKFRTLLLALIGAMALSFGVFALAACSKSDPSTPPAEIGAEYEAIYDNYYKTAAGENAKTLQEWYADLTADLDEISSESPDSIDVIEVDGESYIAVVYKNGKLYIEKLVGGDSFAERVKFTVKAMTATGGAAITTGISLDVSRVANEGANQKVQTLDVGTSGTADAYVEPGNTTYIITVGAPSSAAYGFAPGYEPTFTASQTGKEISVSVQAASDKANHEVVVTYNSTAVSGVGLKLVYAEGDDKAGYTVAEGATGADGKLALSFYKHEGSDYQVEVTTLSDDYETPEATAIDLSHNSTTIGLTHVKQYSADKNVTATGNPSKAGGDLDHNVELVPIPEEEATFDSLIQRTDANTYKYVGDGSNRQVYVMLDKQDDRIDFEKTIKDMLAEAGRFEYEHETDHDTNTWERVKYTQLLTTYAGLVNDQGLYPLNDDLIKFVTDEVMNGKYADDTTEGELRGLITLAVYSKEGNLAAGKNLEDFETTLPKNNNGTWTGSMEKLGKVVLPVADRTTAGWYVLTVKLSGYSATAKLGGYTAGINECSGIIPTTGGTGVTTEVYDYNMFTLTGAQDDGADTYTFKGLVYINDTDRSITLLSDYSDKDVTVNAKLEAATGAIDGVDYSELANALGKNQKSDYLIKGDYTVAVFPESMAHKESSSTNRFSNYTTLGYTFDLNRLNVMYKITVKGVSSLSDLKVSLFNADNFNEFDFKTAQSLSADGLTFGPDGVGTTGNEFTNSIFDCGRFGVVFTHSGAKIETVEITVEPIYSRANVTYKSEETAGKEYVDENVYVGSISGKVLDPEDAKLQFTKEGNVFTGWKIEGTDTILQPGDNFKSSNIHDDVTLIAQWREVKKNTTAELKPDGTEITNVVFDASQYTSTFVPFSADVLSATGYKLTITTTAEWGGRTIKIGSAEVVLHKSADNTYVAYIDRNDADGIEFLTVTAGEIETISIKLEEYANVKLTAGSTMNEVPVTPSSIGAKGGLYIDITGVSGSYNIKALGDVTGNAAYVYTDLSEEDKQTISLGGSSETLITIPEGATKLYIVYVSDSYLTCTLTVSERMYTVYYELSEEDKEAGATGTTNPATNKKSGSSVSVPTAGFTWEGHTFMYWVKKGDESGARYYPGFNVTIEDEDITLVAVMRVNHISGASISASSGNSSDFTIDPEADTSFSITVSGIRDYNAKGITITMDLTNNLDFRGEIPLNFSGNSYDSKARTIIFTHSDYLTEQAGGAAAHNIFVSYDIGVNGSNDTMTYTLNYGNWYKAGNTKISGASVKAANYTYLTSGSTGTAISLDSDQKGNVQAHNSQYNSNEKFVLFNPNLSSLLLGSKFKVHVKAYLNEGKSLGTVTLYSASSKTSIGNSVGTLTASDDNEYTVEYTPTNMLASCVIKISNSGNYMLDVWFERLDPTENVLGKGKPVTIEAQAETEVTVNLDSSVIKGNKYSLSLAGADGAQLSGDITVKYGAYNASSLGTSSSTTIMLNAESLYTAKAVAFGNIAVTVKSATAQKIVVSLADYNSQALSYGENTLQLGADKARTDLNKTGSSTISELTITKSDGNALDSDIKFRTDKQTYTFNAASPTQMVELSDYMEIWSDSGSAVEVKVVAVASYNLGTSSSSKPTFDISEVSPKVIFNIESSVTMNEYSLYKFTVTMPSVPSEELTLTLAYNDGSTIQMSHVSGSTEYTASVCLSNTLVSLTVGGTLSDTISGVKMALSQTQDWSIEASGNHDFAASDLDKDLYVKMGTSTYGTSEKYAIFTAYAKSDSGVDKEAVLTNLKITFTFNGGTFEVTGFTKDEATGKWSVTVEKFLVKTQYVKAKVEGYTGELNIAYEFVTFSNTNVYEAHMNYSISGFNYYTTSSGAKAYKLGESVIIGKEYYLILDYSGLNGSETFNNGQKHSGTDATYKIEGVTAADGLGDEVTLSATTPYRIVKFNARYFKVSMTTTCKATSSRNKTTHYFNFSITDGVKVEAGETKSILVPKYNQVMTGKLSYNTSIIELGDSIDSNKLYKVKIEAGDGQSADEMPAAYSIWKVGNDTSRPIAEQKINKTNGYETVLKFGTDLSKYITIFTSTSGDKESKIKITISEYTENQLWTVGEDVTLTLDAGMGIALAAAATSSNYVKIKLNTSLEAGETVEMSMSSQNFSFTSDTPEMTITSTGKVNFTAGRPISLTNKSNKQVSITVTIEPAA